jgi:secreted trypsin-like serine protease
MSRNNDSSRKQFKFLCTFCGALLIVLCYNLFFHSGSYGQERIWFGLRIIKGEPTTIAKHPWQVAIVIRTSTGSSLCSGSVISTGWIITAAHCFSSATLAADIKIKAGEDDFLHKGKWLEASKIKPHPQYAPLGQVNDIALIKLASQLDARILPIADKRHSTIPEGQGLEIAGWGATDLGGGPSSELKRAEVHFVGQARCNAPDAYNGLIGSGKMCAGDSPSDACQGDSGGPLIWYPHDGALLVGIVSSGEGCAQLNHYGIYTDVAYYDEWIRDSILSN